jgi:hypothetical protein
MNNKHLSIVLVVLISTVVPMGFAENFESRPSCPELNELVGLSTECACGARERGMAAQPRSETARRDAGGWRLSENFFRAMDASIKSAIPAFMDTNSGTYSSPALLTVNSLFARLAVGNRINDFTPVSNWKNYSGTNYWFAAWKEALKERHTVLKALTWTADLTVPNMIHASSREVSGKIGDLEISTFKNKRDQTEVHAYSPDFVAETLGYDPAHNYRTNRNVWKNLGLEEKSVPVRLDQAKKVFEILWYRGLNVNPPPFIITNCSILVATNASGDKSAGLGTLLFCHPGNHGLKKVFVRDSGHVGEDIQVKAGEKSKAITADGGTLISSGGGGDGGGGGGGGGGARPIEIGIAGSGGGGGSSSNMARITITTEKSCGWAWAGVVSAIYGTYVWTNFIIPTGMVCHIEIMCQPQIQGQHLSYFGQRLSDLNELKKVTTSPSTIGWEYPQNWQIALNNWKFKESAGMTTSRYYRIPSSCVRINQDGSNTLSLMLGSDELPPMAQPGSMPDWCTDPVKGQSYNNNAGSVGKALGIWFDRRKIYVLKRWNFLWCTK